MAGHGEEKDVREVLLPDMRQQLFRSPSGRLAMGQANAGALPEK
jgi:hypothetical protein